MVRGAAAVDPALALSAIRVSFGAGNSAQDVDTFIAALAAQLHQLRHMAGRAVG